LCSHAACASLPDPAPALRGRAADEIATGEAKGGGARGEVKSQWCDARPLAPSMAVDDFVSMEVQLLLG
jgi:hypothetical protein